MKLMLIGSWHRATLQEVGSRFASGEHGTPPEPCTMLARWHDPSSRQFWLIVDTPDAATIQEWTSRWSDIIDWKTHTVVDDPEVIDLLGKLLG